VCEALASEHHLFDHTPEAIAHARVHARRMAHTPASAGEPRAKAGPAA
jgi:hypothetical protein